jgi:hypothetical protein
MNQVYLKMCVFVFLQLFLNRSHLHTIDKKILVQNNLQCPVCSGYRMLPISKYFVGMVWQWKSVAE